MAKKKADKSKSKKKVDNSKGKKLTPKQEFFCKEYIIDLNATQAAIRAGYSKATAKDIACQNLAKLNIQDKIAELKAKRSDKVEVKAEDVLRQLKILSNSNIANYVEYVTRKVEVSVGLFKDLKILEFKTFDKLTEDQLLCIESIKEGKHGIELKLHGKEWTIEKINKHIGFYEVDNEQKKPKDTMITEISIVRSKE